MIDTLKPGVSSSLALSAERLALRKAAQSFEAVFLREIIDQMRKAKLAEDAFGSAATDNFREMADANTAEILAKRGSFGIAKLIEGDLAKTGARP
jgi:peptidoglycan hydrolase FlgJ